MRGCYDEHVVHGDGTQDRAAYLVLVNLDGKELLRFSADGDASLRRGFEGLALRRLDLRGRNAQGASFDDCDLRDGGFSKADLYMASFFDCDLRGADFSGAVLLGASFAGSMLSGAVFRGADLGRDAFGVGANLEGVDLSDCELEGAVLDGARVDEKTRWPRGFVAEQHDLVWRDPADRIPSAEAVMAMLDAAKRRLLGEEE